MIVPIDEVKQPQTKPSPYQKTIGKYSYSPKKLLGEGSFGKVFEGKNDKTQEKVAIKIINLKLMQNDSYIQTQLTNEINVLKTLNHQNVLHLLEVINKNDNCYIITEYCEDGNLKDKLFRSSLPDIEALKIYFQLVDGFQALIKKNIIHRDLKPANILFQNKTSKLADFGFSRFVTDFNNCMLKSCVGSPLYMAPQILQRKKYSTKCDIWSMGVILYEMVFGRTPWIGLDERDLLNNILTKPLIFKPNVKISKLTEVILKKSLVISEEDRISWEELIKLKNIKEDENLEEFNKKVEKTRNLTGFLHYVSFEILNNYDGIKSFMKNNHVELNLEKFQITLAIYVKRISCGLNDMVKLKRKNETEKCKNLLDVWEKVLKREMGFFSNFLKDLITFFSKDYLFDSLKQDRLILEAFDEKNQDLNKLNGLIREYGKLFMEKYLNSLEINAKLNKFEENKNFLSCLKCIDYIMDVIFLIRKQNEDVEYRKLHEEKSSFCDEIIYLDALISKKKNLL